MFHSGRGPPQQLRQRGGSRVCCLLVPEVALGSGFPPLTSASPRPGKRKEAEVFAIRKSEGEMCSKINFQPPPPPSESLTEE